MNKYISKRMYKTNYSKIFFACGVIIIIVLLCINKTKTETIKISKDNLSSFSISVNTLFKMKELSTKYNMNFSELVTYFGMENNFNDENFDTDKIEQNFLINYDNIKSKYKSKDINEYFEIVNSLFNEIKYFPVQKGTDEECNYIYGNSWGIERTYGGKRTHEGCDIMDRDNIRARLPIISMTDGKIENLGWNEKGGWRVGIRSKSNIYYYYAHLDSFADNIKKDDEVKAGQLLGYMGDTGYSKIEGTKGNFEVHLHVGIAFNDKLYDGEWWINPYPFLRLIETLE